MNKYFRAAHSVEIPARKSSCSRVKVKIPTPYGPVLVRDGWAGMLSFLGAPDAIISLGLIEPEWQPGLPGTNATAQAVYFEESGPLLQLGKPRGKRPTAPRILIRAWGQGSRRTVEVQVPASERQLAALQAPWIEEVPYRHNVSVLPQRPAYRTEGNVIYLFGGAAS